MTSQNDRQDRSLTGQVRDQAGQCLLTGRYFQPCLGIPRTLGIHFAREVLCRGNEQLATKRGEIWSRGIQIHIDHLS